MKHHHLPKALLAAALAVTMLVAMVPAAFAAETGEKTITILGTSDTHSNIWGFAYEDNAESTNNGMARIYSYIQSVRAENPNTLLIDNGDTIQGTILSDDIYNKQEGEHPVISAMNHMGYDCMTLGNHEFNFGLALVDRIVELADFPILSANTTYKDSGELFVGDYTILETAGVKVAVIGVTTPNIPTWDGEKVDALSFEAMSSAVDRCIDAIGDQADVILVSAHAGLAAEFDEDGGADSAQKILDDNPEVDVLMVGHYHIVVNETQDDVVIGAPRNAGRDVVRFDLTLNADNEITASAVDVVDMANVEPSAELRDLAIVKESHQKTIDFINGGGSGDGEEGGGVLGTTTAKFQPVDEIATLPQGKLEDTAVMDLINKVQLENSGADVSAAALFKDTSDLPEGDINYGNIFNIYKFDNTLYRVTVTGAELKAYMEWSAECYNQWVPGDINISFDPEYPGYLYDMFAGVDYEIDLSQPKGQRIKNVMFKGQPLADDQVLSLAVNNYRYSSALKTKGLVAGKRDWESPNSIRDMLVSYFAEHSPVAPEVDHNWKITGVDLQLDDPDRATLIALVNNGQLEAPYDKSLNLNDPTVQAVLAKANNVTVDGEARSVERTVIDGETYYRLRDLAVALKGTEGQFNVAWDNGVVITTGAEYADAPLSLVTGATKAAVTGLTATVDGVAATTAAAQVIIGDAVDGNYYVTADGIASLLGLSATVTDGVLVITTK